MALLADAAHTPATFSNAARLGCCLACCRRRRAGGLSWGRSSILAAPITATILLIGAGAIAVGGPTPERLNRWLKPP
jgi:Co/Zn/Cd efflux system component